MLGRVQHERISIIVLMLSGGLSFASVQQIAREVEKAEKAKLTKKPQIPVSDVAQEFHTTDERHLIPSLVSPQTRKGSTSEEIEQDKKAYGETNSAQYSDCSIIFCHSPEVGGPPLTSSWQVRV